MKTYFINTIKNIAANSQSLDLTSTLKSQEWIVFNDDDSFIEKFLFIDNEKLLVSVNGKSSYSKWQYIKVNSSLVIDDENSKYLLKVVVCNKDIVVLNVDSTSDYSFLINSKSSALQNPTYEDIQWYLMRNCGIDILDEEQREIFEKKITEEKRIIAEGKRMIEEKKEKGQKIIAVLLAIVFCAITLFLAILLLDLNMQKVN